MKRVAAIAIALVFTACAVLQKPTAVDLKPIPVSEFLDRPFGHDESIESFQNTLPVGTKVQKLIRRSGYKHHKPDTIYNFKYKKSKIAVYKTQFNQEFLLGGFVNNPEIEMINGIRKGMEREKFYKAFTDLEFNPKDSVVLNHPQRERKFSFYFDKRGRLEKFNFSGSSTK
jgi:hypothetical protein